MAGTEIWRYQDGTNFAGQYIGGAAATSDGSFVVAGDTGGNWTGVSAGLSDLVAVKISSNGTVLWGWQGGSSGYDEIRAVVALSDGSVVVAGAVNGTWSGGDQLGAYDFAAIKLNLNGTLQWAWQEGTEKRDFIRTAVVTADETMVLAGYTSGSWAKEQLQATDAAAVKLDANGTMLWRWQGGSNLTDYIYASTARPDGSVVLAGSTAGSWYGELSPEVTEGFVAVALDQHGEELWHWQDGTGGVNALLGATSLTDGSVVLVGYTDGNWGGINQGGKDFAAVKLDVDGVETWRWQDGTSEDDEWRTSVSSADGSIVFAGYTKGSWGGTNQGEQDFAALSLDEDGEVLWTYQAGTAETDHIMAAAIRTDGAVLLAGWTKGSWDKEDSGENPDFAAVLLDTGAAAPTPPPVAAEPVITPTPLTFFTSSPTASVTPSWDAMLTVSPTASPTATDRGRSPAEPSPEPPTSVEMTITPMRTEHPTTIDLLVGSSPPSSAPVVPRASSGSSTALVIGVVAGVVASLVVIGVCIFKHREAAGREEKLALVRDSDARES